MSDPRTALASLFYGCTKRTMRSPSPANLLSGVLLLIKININGIECQPLLYGRDQGLKAAPWCRCVYQQEDAEGKVGVTLTKDIVKVAARALQTNLSMLAPLVLPWSELLKYGVDAVQRKLGLREGPPYQPDFGKAFDHFCLHAGDVPTSVHVLFSNTRLSLLLWADSMCQN